MACPFFMPTGPLDSGPWIVPPRLPLNGAWQGVCRASAESFEPSEKSQRELCNCGYARGHCERFPAEAADAVRFSIASEHDGLLRLVYILERDHSPEHHGFLEYSIAERRLLGDPGEILSAQAGAFIAATANSGVRFRL